MKNFKLGVRTGLLFVIVLTSTSQSWEVNTHRIISSRAFELHKNEIIEKLTGPYGFPRNSFDQTITLYGRSLKLGAWVENGAEDEDFPDRRVVNHFHVPLLSYNQGFPPTLMSSIGNSSVYWSQFGAHMQFDFLSQMFWGIRSVSPHPDFHNTSWQDARQYFKLSLISKSEDFRMAYLARTLNSIGHLAHLIQDAANPAHVRNDTHIPRINRDEFHAWLSNRPDLVLIAGIEEPEQAMLMHEHNDPSGALAPLLPIANLIDNNKYRSAATASATLGGLAGTSEFAAANFVSDDTRDVFRQSGDPLTPKPDVTDIESETNVDPGTNREYLVFRRDGSIPGQSMVINHFLVRSALVWGSDITDVVGSQIGPLAFDNQVFAEYASKLIPKAIGYSAALFRYFFRGELKVDSRGETEIDITNPMSEEMEGSFSIFYDRQSGERAQVPGAAWSLKIDAGKKALGLQFLPPTDAKEPGKYLLLFDGRLGAEFKAPEDVGAIVATEFKTEGQLRMVEFTPIGKISTRAPFLHAKFENSNPLGKYILVRILVNDDWANPIEGFSDQNTLMIDHQLNHMLPVGASSIKVNAYLVDDRDHLIQFFEKVIPINTVVPLTCVSALTSSSNYDFRPYQYGCYRDYTFTCDLGGEPVIIRGIYEQHYCEPGKCTSGSGEPQVKWTSIYPFVRVASPYNWTLPTSWDPPADQWSNHVNISGHGTYCNYDFNSGFCSAVEGIELKFDFPSCF